MWGINFRTILFVTLGVLTLILSLSIILAIFIPEQQAIQIVNSTMQDPISIIGNSPPIMIILAIVIVLFVFLWVTRRYSLFETYEISREDSLQ